MQVLSLKIDKTKGVRGTKLWQFTYFKAYIFTRMVRKLERYCKIKIMFLNLWFCELFELVSL